jgi:hypothetical protein
MDLFATDFDDFEPRQDFFPYFPAWQGKYRHLGLRRDKGQRLCGEALVGEDDA